MSTVPMLPMSTDAVALLSVAALGTLLLLATARDLAARRIPNTIVAAGLVLAAASHAAALALGQRPLAGAAVLAPLAGLATGGALLLPLYLLRGCAAGDVKLMAMAGAFIGPRLAVDAVLATLVAGGVMSIAALCRPGVAAAAWRRVRPGPGAAPVGSPLARTAFRLPYAPAIAAGTALALWRHVAGAGS